jgi:hypothetical protein
VIARFIIPSAGNKNSSTDVPIRDDTSSNEFYTALGITGGPTGDLRIDITPAGVIELVRSTTLGVISESGTITLTSTLFQQFGRIVGPLGSPLAQLSLLARCWLSLCLRLLVQGSSVR